MASSFGVDDGVPARPWDADRTEEIIDRARAFGKAWSTCGLRVRCGTS
jgi:hypothetical protein